MIAAVEALLAALAAGAVFAILFVPGTIPLIGLGVWKLCGGC